MWPAELVTSPSSNAPPAGRWVGFGPHAHLVTHDGEGEHEAEREGGVEGQVPQHAAPQQRPCGAPAAELLVVRPRAALRHRAQKKHAWEVWGRG